MEMADLSKEPTESMLQYVGRAEALAGKIELTGKPFPDVLSFVLKGPSPVAQSPRRSRLALSDRALGAMLSAICRLWLLGLDHWQLVSPPRLHDVKVTRLAAAPCGELSNAGELSGGSHNH
ncbi:hypothetical protein HaLaN_20784 [Haematococcus lacustris]|uniref:Uncharacterized protein n=1 Tax=Haematococcus lacustris TaxID=44745 RepID=A0A699ZX04_HAELA|nr:hypothetical protein HaLaN_20784 [Haematococcus lacustris]